MKVRKYLTIRKIEELIKSSCTDDLENIVLHLVCFLITFRLDRSFLFDNEIKDPSYIDQIMKKHSQKLVVEVNKVVDKKRDNLFISCPDRLLNEKYNNLNAKEINNILNSLSDDILYIVDI